MVHGAPARKKSQSGVCSSNAENINAVGSVQPTPPDGGWGWMVVFGSFMIHIISKYGITGITDFYSKVKTRLNLL